MGLDNTVDTLLASLALPDPPLNPDFPDDPYVPIGSTWVDQPYADTGSNFRWRSLRGWLINSLQDPYLNIREKMVLFWANHFGMADVGDERVQYDYVRLYRGFATGNFRDLVKAVTVHPSMLMFLNGNVNHKDSPNENYARELLELFTIGKGPQIGPGDYTNYTEQDIQQMARILTGWITVGVWSGEPGILPHSAFDDYRHDSNSKTLSHRFDNVTFNDEGDEEYASLIDLIFTKEEVSRFICRKLYRYFVYYKWDDAVEQAVIEPLAQIFRDNNYEIAPVLAALFRSTHFYEIGTVGDVIKNPLEFILGVTRPMDWGRDNFPMALKYDSGNALHWWASQLDLDFFFPPSVSGWPSWHLTPSYNRLWLNSSTLQRRVDLTQGIGWSGIWVDGEGRPMDWLGFITTFDDPTDPNELVREFAEVFLPQELQTEQLDELKESLIPGLPDFEWTVEYGTHLSNPDDEMLRESVIRKIRALARTLFRMAEFQLN